MDILINSVELTRNLSIEVHKILTQQSPSLLDDLYSRKVTQYKLRYNEKVQHPAYNTMTFGKNFLRYQGAKLWWYLSIPTHLQTVHDEW